MIFEERGFYRMPVHFGIGETATENTTMGATFLRRCSFFHGKIRGELFAYLCAAVKVRVVNTCPSAMSTHNATHLPRTFCLIFDSDQSGNKLGASELSPEIEISKNPSSHIQITLHA